MTNHLTKDEESIVEFAFVRAAERFGLDWKNYDSSFPNFWFDVNGDMWTLESYSNAYPEFASMLSDEERAIFEKYDPGVL